MAMNLAPVLRQRYLDANGNPLAGGKLYTYQAGTTTPQATYTDSSGGTPNANPVVLDANGEASVWLSDSLAYKFVLKDANDVAQWTQDNVNGGPSSANSGIATAKLADDSVTAEKLRDDEATDSNRAVTTNHIRNLAVTKAKIASDVADGTSLEKATGGELRIKDSGVSTAKLASGAVTQEKRAPLGLQVSSSSGDFSTQSTSYVDVTNLTVTITTSGRPVFIGLTHDGSAFNSYIGTGSQYSPFYRIVRDGTVVYAGTGDTLNLVGSLWVIDTPAAGTYTYKLQACTNSDVYYTRVNYAKLAAYEL